MSSEITKENQIILETKDILYKFYYELQSELKGKEIEVPQDEYEDALYHTKLPTLLHYIKETIYTLIKQRTPKQIQPVPLTEGEKSFRCYEAQLRKYENDVRNLVKKQFQYKIQREAMEMRMEEYMMMEESFEEMKEKLKYEDGKFLDNDKKDNEIFILRAENTNLKNVISQLEKDKKNIETESRNDKEVINELKSQVEILYKKVGKLEQLQKDLSSASGNSSINININNNGNNTTKWVIKHEELLDRDVIPHSIRKKLKERNDSEISLKHSKLPSHQNHYYTKSNHNISASHRSKLIDCNNFDSTYNKILSDLSHTKSTCNSRQKSNHQKNNSMNMNLDNSKKVEIMQKYFSNQNNMSRPMSNNYTKITNLIPNSKFPITNRTIHNKHILSKLYMQNNNKLMKSGNKSTLSIRGQSQRVDN